MKKISRTAVYILGGAFLCSLTSCDLYERIFKKKETNTVTKEVVLPQDREVIQEVKSPKTYSPAEFSKGIIKGDWAIEKVYDRDAVGETAPYIKFSQDDDRIYGSNGCNVINGDYAYNPSDSTLTFSNIAVTMRLCHTEGITDYLVNKALDDTHRYALEDVEDGYEMKLFDGEGREVMLLVHQNLDFLNGTWKIVEIDGEPVNIEKMKLVFDIDENKVHGNTGCNVFNGTLATDLDVPNTFSFEAMAVTMMMCPEMEYQTALLVALEEACRAKPINKNCVQLLDSWGSPVLVLEHTTDK